MADIYNAFFAKKAKLTVSIGKTRNTAINSEISHEPYLHMKMPNKVQIKIRIDRRNCSVNMLEPLAYCGGECKIDTNYLLLFREF